MKKSIIIALATVTLAFSASATEISISFDDSGKAISDTNYDFRDRQKIKSEIATDLTKALENDGCDAARIEIQVIEAKPNMTSQGQRTFGASNATMRSITSRSGMWLKGTAFDVDGNVIATHEYQGLTRNSSSMSATNRWSDAFKASDRFSRKFAEKL